MPVRLCPLPGTLYTVLMGYKESPLSEARRHFSVIVKDLAAGFLGHHSQCMTAAVSGPFDFALPVPSSSRPGRAPLDRVVGLAEEVERALPPARWCPGLLERSARAIAHMRPDAGAFAVPVWARPSVEGSRVVLLDDTYVSGSRAQSAAAALRLAGARATLIVALGRVLRPDRSLLHAQFVGRYPAAAALGTPDGPSRCCRCVQTAAPSG
jgi:hypothetical protein